MRLKSHREAENTRTKLAHLEGLYAQALHRDMATPELKQLSLYSLRRMINQLKEELIRFDCDVKAHRIPAEAAASGE